MFSQHDTNKVCEAQTAQNVFPINSDLRDCTALFGALTDTQVAKLLSYSKRKTFVPGERIFNQGDLPESIYFGGVGSNRFSGEKKWHI